MMAPGKTDIFSSQFTRLSPSSSTASSNKSRGKSAPIERSSQLSLTVVGSPAPRTSALVARRYQGMRSNPRPPQEEPLWPPHKVLHDTWLHGKSSAAMKPDSPCLIHESPASPSQHLTRILLQPDLPLSTLMRSRPYSSSFLHSSVRCKERNRAKPHKPPQKLSITSSSAGDISSDTMSRPLAPSPPSSESQINSSLPSSTPTSSEQEVQEHSNNKYSFPVPPLQLSNRIKAKLKSQPEQQSYELIKIEEISTQSSYTQQRQQSECSVSKHDTVSDESLPHVSASLPLAGDKQSTIVTPPKSISDVDLALVNIQEQVLKLVDSQQACTRSTWLLMQRLSASLDQLTTTDHPPPLSSCACPPPTHLPPPVLLMEAAGCARRLADILSLLGAAPRPRDPPPPPAPPPVLPCLPTATQLQQQRTRLRPVSTPSGSVRPNRDLAAILGAAIAHRRCSVAPDDASNWGSDV